MDPSVIIGIGLAFGGIFGSVVIEGGNPMAIVLIPPMLLVFFGTFGATIAGGTLPDAKAIPKNLIKAIKAKPASSDELIEVIVRLAGKARREGLLALEDEAAGIEDEFLKRGLQLAIDGTDAEEVGIILSSEVDTKRAADHAAAKAFENLGGFAPTIGIIGTVMGLVKVLGNLSTPSKLGAEIASAFVATLWGVMTANVVWLPIANRLKRISAGECQQMDVVIEGILAIQAGANPRLVEQKLLSLIPSDPSKQDEKDVA
jgi:chemotaxis protein MotA